MYMTFFMSLALAGYWPLLEAQDLHEVTEIGSFTSGCQEFV